MSSSTSGGAAGMIRIRPGTGQQQQQSSSSPVLMCNKCVKPLVATCYLCVCDCIFCEDCTFSHFEQSPRCPSCGTTLGEDDFTELVVADPSGNTTGIDKSRFQALLTKKSDATSLHLADLCHGMMSQIDTLKLTNRFVLKQLLVETTLQGRKNAKAMQVCEALKAENTQLKQTSSNQRLQYESVITELQNQNAALEKKLEDKNKKIERFQRLVSNRAVPSPSHADRVTSSRNNMQPQQQRQEQEPPLRGFMMRKEAKQRAQQQAYQNQRRAPSVLGKRGPSSAPSSSHASPANPYHHHGVTPTPIQVPAAAAGGRPFSNHSTGSIPSTPRIRDLSPKAGYVFHASTSVGAAGGGRNNRHINKRRRSAGGTPTSGGLLSSHQVMSPSTAFTLNQGPHHGSGGPSQYFGRGGGSSGSGSYGRHR